jgi:anti-anti-sigma factor
MSNAALEMTELRNGQFCVVALRGRIDSTNSNELLNRLNGLICSGEKQILVDFGSVMYLTSAAFRALLVAAKEAERNAARFVLCSLTTHVRELFELAGLLDMFTIHTCRDDALAPLA